MSEKDSSNILDLFRDNKLTKICAPMVRYSKLQFRNLVQLYDCDLTFTPMILADSFCQSEKARQNEFRTNLVDTPIITQFAANTVHEFVGAAYLASPYCDGVDLNCGCPQRWARELDLGCALLKKPDLIYDLVRQCRNQISEPFSISIKMRLLSDNQETLEICRQLEKCGVSFISIHARTATQLVGDINESVLRIVKDTCNIPIIANGGVTTLDDCIELQQSTGCDGIMVANGILTNPGLFSGIPVTSRNCIQNWLDICYNSTLTLELYKKELLAPKLRIEEKPYNLTFQCFHHHLVFMLEKILDRKERAIFNNLKSFSTVLEFIETNLNLKPRLYDIDKFLTYAPLTLDYSSRVSIYEDLKPTNTIVETDECDNYEYDQSDGQYFNNKTSSSDCDWSNIFLENG